MTTYEENYSDLSKPKGIVKTVVDKFKFASKTYSMITSPENNIEQSTSNLNTDVKLTEENEYNQKAFTENVDKNNQKKHSICTETINVNQDQRNIYKSKNNPNQFRNSCSTNKRNIQNKPNTCKEHFENINRPKLKARGINKKLESNRDTYFETKTKKNQSHLNVYTEHIEKKQNQMYRQRSCADENDNENKIRACVDEKSNSIIGDGNKIDFSKGDACVKKNMVCNENMKGDANIISRNCSKIESNLVDKQSKRNKSYHIHPEWFPKKYIFKAKPVPKHVMHEQGDVGVRCHHSKTTNVEPFSFDERDKDVMKKKREKMMKLLEDEQKLRIFHARPVPKWINKRNINTITSNHFGVDDKKSAPNTEIALNQAAVFEKTLMKLSDRMKKLETNDSEKIKLKSPNSIVSKKDDKLRTKIKVEKKLKNKIVEKSKCLSKINRTQNRRQQSVSQCTKHLKKSPVKLKNNSKKAVSPNVVPKQKSPKKCTNEKLIVSKKKMIHHPFMSKTTCGPNPNMAKHGVLQDIKLEKPSSKFKQFSAPEKFVKKKFILKSTNDFSGQNLVKRNDWGLKNNSFMKSLGNFVKYELKKKPKKLSIEKLGKKSNEPKLIAKKIGKNMKKTSLKGISQAQPSSNLRRPTPIENSKETLPPQESADSFKPTLVPNNSIELFNVSNASSLARLSEQQCAPQSKDSYEYQGPNVANYYDYKIIQEIKSLKQSIAHPQLKRKGSEISDGSSDLSN